MRARAHAHTRTHARTHERTHTRSIQYATGEVETLDLAEIVRDGHMSLITA